MRPTVIGHGAEFEMLGPQQASSDVHIYGMVYDMISTRHPVYQMRGVHVPRLGGGRRARAALACVAAVPVWAKCVQTKLNC